MRIVHVGSCLLPMMLLACAAPLKNMPSPSQAQALQAILEDAVADSEGFGGGVLTMLSPRGEVLWEGAAGHAHLTDGPPMTRDATFDIASITKTFTAVVIMQLVELGRLRLTDSIAAHLPAHVAQSLLVQDGHDSTASITVAQLLQHTSGLPDYWTDPPFEENDANAFLRAFLADPNRLWKPEEMLQYARGLRPIGAPGERFHYCDTGYVLLGLMIENITGMSLAEVFQKNIFTPLHMSDTFLAFTPPNVTRLPSSDRFEGELALSVQPRQSADWASGGLVSSTRDLGHFIVSLWQGTLFARADTLAHMQVFRPTGGPEVEYGLGLFRVTIGAQQGTLWGHDGHGNAFMYVWPERGVAFVGTLNQVDNDWWPLIWEAIQVVLGQGLSGGPASKR